VLNGGIKINSRELDIRERIYGKRRGKRMK
jgi:hypothetical protein